MASLRVRIREVSDYQGLSHQIAASDFLSRFRLEQKGAAVV
jgi:hypothetical protein